MQHLARYKAKPFPMEMHKVRVIQKLNLLPISSRLKAIQEAGNNTFLLKNRDVFLDMLTDSGTNAMSDQQIAAMSLADDSYAGSETFFRLEASVQHFFNMPFFLPAHQGRACEHILAKTFVKAGDVVPMNFHFTTTRAHIIECGGRVEECFNDEAIHANSTHRFKGDMDMDKLAKCVEEVGLAHIPFVRIELGTNLIGGQPISLSSIQAVSQFCHKNKLLLVLDASLLSDNLYFMKMFDPLCQHLTIEEINHEISKCADIIYFSARKLSSARGGGIVLRDKELFDRLKVLVPLYEGFLTYGGMSVREMEAMAIGLTETLDFEMLSQGPQFIEAFGQLALENHLPVVTPFGGLGLHLNAREFLAHVPQDQYPAGALAAAIYLVSGARGMERGTISENRNADGSEHPANMELVRLALPRRVFTLSHIIYMVDRLSWLHENRHLIGGLTFTEEPKIMRFFLGRLAPIGDWQEKLVEKFIRDFGPEAL